MEFLSAKRIEKFKIEIVIINITLILFIFRGTFPVAKIPFLVLYIPGIIYLLFVNRKNFFSDLYKFASDSLLIIFLFLILIIAFFLSDKIYLVVFKDIINIAILLSVFISYYLVLNSRNKLDFFITSFIDLIIYFGFFVSAIGVLETFTLISTRDFDKIDYNFALLPVFFGIIGIIFKLLKNEVNKYERYFMYFSLYLSFTQAFFSGSRRGFVVLILIFFVLLFSQVLKYYKKKSTLKPYLLKLLNIPTAPFVLFLFVPIFWFVFLFQTPFIFKEKFFEILPVNNKSLAKMNIAYKISRSVQIFGIKVDFNDLYKRLWAGKFDPLDPDSGWGTRIHKTVFPLTGSNVEIVPDEAKGYLIDKNTNTSTWENNAFSYTEIWSGKVGNQDSLIASVYCYVSGDFDGEWINLSCEGNTSGTNLCYYDLKRIGEWQKLKIIQGFHEGNAAVYLYLGKYGVTDFSSLKGYVIFSYPEVKYKRYSLDSTFIPEYDSSLSQNFREPIVNPQIKSSFMAISGFAMPKSFINTDPDFIRRLTSKFISEDTTYHGFKSEIVVETINSKLLGPRLMRWKFAWQIFVQEYDIKKKIFGGGFNYLNWFGFYFFQDKILSDYPHNPFLSILLYSGLFGLLVYLMFFLKSFYYYKKLIPQFGIFFIYFIITCVFSFFSSGNPFDPPVMGFFVIFPYLINSIFKRIG